MFDAGFEDCEPFDAEDELEVWAPLSLAPASEDPVLDCDDPEPWLTPAQNEETPAVPAAFSRFLKATLWLFGCPLLAM